MKAPPIAARTLLTSSLAVIAALIGVLILFSWIDGSNRDRTISERAQLEISSIQLLVNDSYTIGDVIGLRKYLDTFSKLNSWESGSLVDSLGAEIWRLESKPAAGSNRVRIQSEIKTTNGGKIGQLVIEKNQTTEIEKWNAQRMLSLLGLAGIAVVVLFIQNFTLFKILRPVSALTTEIRREAAQMNLQLTSDKGEDDIFLVKRWFSEVALSWHCEKERAALESRFRAIGSLAAQVAHDIRSPLAALDIILGKTKELPEGERILVRTAVNRIKDIANNLIVKNKEIGTWGFPDDVRADSIPLGAASTHLLSSLIDPLITEKRMQYRSKIGVEIDALLGLESYGLFARVQPMEFNRVLSNLINNSVEALNDSGRVTLSAVRIGQQISISIRDNGKGIPPQVLPKLGNRGETHGKEGGSGLGLYHARTTVESWGGKLALSARLAPHPEQGTTVTVMLPMAEAPGWFVSKLELHEGSIIVVLDDDPSIHGIWQGRFNSLRLQERSIEVRYFSTPAEITDFARNQTGGMEVVYLVDYELLGHMQNGLDLIDVLCISQQSVLVTSRFEEKLVLERAAKLNVKLIPKSMAAFVPVSIAKPLEMFDAILIDDDDLMHLAWARAAEDKGLRFRWYANKDAFLADAKGISPETPLYIDANLGNGVTGEDVGRAANALGFKVMHLATGYEPDRFAHLLVPKGPFTSIRGKEPTF